MKFISIIHHSFKSIIHGPRKRPAPDPASSAEKRTRAHDPPAWVGHLLAGQRTTQELLTTIIENQGDLGRKMDDLKVVINSKMATMEGKIQTSQARITSLQEARRDGLLGRLIPSSSSAPLPAVPHYVPASDPPAPSGQPGMGPATGIDLRKLMGLPD